MRPPIFVLGCPRSGTTLLANLLTYTEHGSPVETHFITKYYKKLTRYGNLQEKRNFEHLIKDILRERPVMQWKLKLDIEQFYSKVPGFGYREIVDGICMERARMKEHQAWGDKTPAYILDLDILYKLFPDSKYIYIVRDGRDVALSLLEREWGPNNIFSCAQYWKNCNAQHPIFDLLKAEQKLYQLRYEDLLDNPAPIVSELYQFLDQSEHLHKVVSPLSRIRKGNYFKWKTAMSPDQIDLFERVAGRTLRRFGYETNCEEVGVGKFTETLWTLHDAMKRVRFLIKNNTVNTIKIRFFGKEPFAE